MENKNKSFNRSEKEFIEPSDDSHTESSEESAEEMLDKLPKKQKEEVQLNFAWLGNGHMDAGEKLIEMNLSEKLTQAIAQRSMEKLLSKGRYYQCLKADEMFNVSEEFLDSDEMRKAAEKGIRYLISRVGSFESLSENAFVGRASKPESEIPDSMIQETRLDILNHIKEKWNISEDKIIEFGIDVIQSLLPHAGKDQDNTRKEILDIKDSLNIPENLIKEKAKEFLETGKYVSDQEKYKIKEVFEIE